MTHPQRSIRKIGLIISFVSTFDHFWGMTRISHCTIFHIIKLIFLCTVIKLVAGNIWKIAFPNLHYFMYAAKNQTSFQVESEHINKVMAVSRSKCLKFMYLCAMFLYVFVYKNMDSRANFFPYFASFCSFYICFLFLQFKDKMQTIYFEAEWFFFCAEIIHISTKIAYTHAHT